MGGSSEQNFNTVQVKGRGQGWGVLLNQTKAGAVRGCAHYYCCAPNEGVECCGCCDLGVAKNS